LGSRYFSVAHAWLCNVLEDKQSALAVDSDGIRIDVPAFGIVTVRMETKPTRGFAGGQP
jgi:hypothetical protein